MLHTGRHMEVSGQERPRVPRDVSEMLRRKNHRGDKFLAIALKPAASKPDHRVLVIIKNEPVLGAIDTKLMYRRAHLRRKGEICGRPLRISNDDPKFVHDILFAHLLKRRA